MHFKEFLLLDEAIKRRQKSSHKQKKAIKRHLAAIKTQSHQELKRLAKISAKRAVKNTVSMNMFRKKYSDLSPVEKDKVTKKVKENIFRQKVIKAAHEKFSEKLVKQKEKRLAKFAEIKKHREKEKSRKEKELIQAKKEKDKRAEQEFEKKLD